MTSVESTMSPRYLESAVVNQAYDTTYKLALEKQALATTDGMQRLTTEVEKSLSISEK